MFSSIKTKVILAFGFVISLLIGILKIKNKKHKNELEKVKAESEIEKSELKNKIFTNSIVSDRNNAVDLNNELKRKIDEKVNSEDKNSDGGYVSITK